jgi:hypothetical protein
MIAKSSPSLTPESPSQASVISPLQGQTYMHDGVPVDVFRHFNIPMEMADNKTKDMLREIAGWAFEGESIGDGLQKLRNLERKLGMAGYRETHSKVWNWIKLQRQVDELTKRQNSLVI